MSTLAAIMAEHGDGTHRCWEGVQWLAGFGFCLPYRLASLGTRWHAETQDGVGWKREHWRGEDFVDGQDVQAEACADELRSVLAGEQ